MRRFDLLNHPIRLRIVLALYDRQLTTSQVAEVLKDVPRASLYRHISQLLQGGVLEVVETRLIKGIEERTLTAVKSELQMSKEDVKDKIDVDEFAEFVSMYGTIAANDAAAAIVSDSNLDVDQLLFRDYDFAATDEEFIALRDKISQLLEQYENIPPTAERRKRRLFILSYPARETTD
ncbi:helix-turn-helix domain-containing protein [Aggregatilineales bacterium SYSU G02658]